MRLLLLVLLLLPGCPDGDMGDFQGFLEVADAWGFAPENARGVCLFDADGDADLDVLFTQRESLRFYLNFAPEFFVEATAGAGLDGNVGESPAGCGAADLDGDGDRDLIVTFNRDDTRVFTNDGAAHFADATIALGFNGWGQSSVVFEDVDRDGRIDVLLSGARNGRTQLLQNAGTFLDITPPEVRAVEHSWGGALFDADNDHLPDLFLGTGGTEAETPDMLLHNDGGLAFSVVESSLSNTASAMGLAVADVDADGFLDLYVTNIGHHPLWRNDGEGSFVDLAVAVGVGGERDETGGWGGGFFDPNDDGELDLFKANGGFSLPLGTMDNFERKTNERNQFFAPRRDSDPVVPGLGQLTDVAADLGLDDGGSALGAAWGDLNGDGLVDLIVANREGAPSRVYQNLGSTVDPGRLRLSFDPLGVDADGFGTRVSLDACGATQEGLLGTGPSVFSQSETTMHFGLNGCREDVVATVRWPSGATDSYTFRVTQYDPYVGPIRLVQGEL